MVRPYRQAERTADSKPRRSSRNSYLLVWLSLILGVSLQGCALRMDRPAPGSEQTPYFLPPTQPLPQPALESGVPTEEIQAEPTLSCEDNLAYLSDQTYPDGSSVQPGATLDKRWEVRNSGTCNWDERYSLRLIAGERLGADERLALYPARSDTTAVIRITFQAPLEPGSYRSAWQAFNPAGEPFGDLIFLDINVTD